jgi:hypothetical protein
MKRSEAIKMLLTKKTHPDLAALYSKDMEVQFNVAQDGGERIDEDYKGKHFHSYTDGEGNKWSHFRIPRNAKTDPEDNDADVYTDLYKHAEGVGMTGWDWKNRVSRWVAYDFDAMTGHSDKHAKKMTDIELQQLKEVVSSIPWVTIRLSTSGKGIHLYVFVEPVETKNHTEHAALARAILGMMAAITAFDFQSKVDTCGGNMWVWHRKMANTPGLKLVKQGEILTEIPPNWRDHIRVVSGAGRKTIPAFIEDKDANPALKDMFEEITGQKSRIPLDEEHQKLIRFFHDNKACAWWDQDHHMLVTHTVHLNEAHEKLGLRGVFKTNAKGENYGADHNCFAYPLRRGAWVVRRYTPGVAEESTWDQDGQGWTRCYLNRELDLATACRAFAGLEHPSGGYIFQEAEVASKAAILLGMNLNIPSWANSRNTRIKTHKDGRFIVTMDKTDNDPGGDLKGWVAEKKQWIKIFAGNHTAAPEADVGNYDEAVRHIISSAGSDMGWVMKSEKAWREEPRTHVIDFLKGTCGLKTNEVQTVMGNAIAKPWQIVCRPFDDEYPKTIEGREWNRKAPQLKYRPSDSDTLSYPTWLKILNHCGRSLDEAVKKSQWAKQGGIQSGADYLKVWLASLFQEPMSPLPYLFFYGPQDSGKSIFYESVRECLVTSGIVRADNALTNQQSFNGELENAILCVVEETDMRQSKVAYNRIKDWVTARELPIHPKTKTPYDVINTTHWVQTANDYLACPVMGGDTRIVVAYVDELLPHEKIPKKAMLISLEKEAPDFIAALLNLPIPDSNDRLNVPVISTEEKVRAVEASQTQLEMFIADKCFHVPGEMLGYGTFYDRFIEWLPQNLIQNWPKIEVGRKLPRQFPKGRNVTSNQVMIGNITFEEPKPDAPVNRALICKDEKLVPIDG